MSIALRWASATHQGRVRRANQDAVLAGPDVFAVADGMGGYSGGEIASSMAAAALSRMESLRTHPDPVTAIDTTLRNANRAIHERARSAGVRAMGTTVSGFAWAGGSDFVVFNVGDSRVYRLRDRGCEQLTEDDSVVAELVRAGEISVAESAAHPHRNVVTRSLGVEPDVQIATSWERAQTGDLYIVASDGLFNEVHTVQMASVACGDETLERRARRLIDAALGGGGRDNISVVLVEVDPQEGLVGAFDHDTSPTHHLLTDRGNRTSTL